MQHQYYDNREEEHVATPTAVRVKSILLAEDDHEMRTLLEHRLRKEGYDVEPCSDGFELLQHFGTFSGDENNRFDLVVSDIRMPGFTGLEILDFIYDNGGFPPSILITAFGDEDTHTEAERLGVAAVLDKPFDLDHLVSVVRRVLAAADTDALPSKKKQKPEPLGDDTLPLEVIFRRFPRLPDLEKHIHQAAGVLEPYRSEILFCRVIVSVDRRSDEPKWAELRIIVTVPGKVFVASNTHAADDEPAGINDAVSKVFDIIEGRLRKYYEKYPPIEQ